MIRLTGLTLENRTPHVVRVRVGHKKIVELPASDRPIRIKQHPRPRYFLETSDGNIILGDYDTTLPRFRHLPRYPRDDVIYIVSGIVASTVKRWNFMSPRADPEGFSRSANGELDITSGFIMHEEMPDDIIKRYAIE